MCSMSGLWTSHVDPATGRTYYFNMRSMKSVWVNPALAAVASAAPVAAAAAAAAPAAAASAVRPNSLHACSA